MNKVNQILEEKVMPIAGRIAGQRHLQALRDGIILTMPLIIIGSFFSSSATSRSRDTLSLWQKRLAALV